MIRATRRGLVATFVLGASLLPAPAASATTIAVNCASANLQTKINNAANGSTLLIKGTCHGQFTLDRDLTLKGNPTATLDGDSGGRTLTVTGARSIHLRSLVVTGGLAETGAGVDQQDGGLLTLDHVTVRDNQAAGATAGGGGIFANGSVVAIRNSTLVDNHAVSSGSGLAVAQAGAVYLQNGSLTISNSLVRGNDATAVSMASLAEGDAGAVFAFETSLTITSSRFRSNVVTANAAESPSAQAGAVLWQQQAGALTITDSTFVDNRAAATSSGTHQVNALAGALKASAGSSSSALKVAGTVFDGNEVSATATVSSAVARGGAASIESQTQVFSIASVQVLNSAATATGATTATASGGGIDMDGRLAMTGSTVSGNTVRGHSGNNAGSGSGGGMEVKGTGLALISDSTVSGNSVIAESDHSGAGAGGGGIGTDGAARLTLKRSTVSGNTASATSTDSGSEALGGGLDLESTSESDEIVNSTIAGNHATVSGPNSVAAGAGIEIVDQGLHVKFSTIARNGAAASGSGTLFAGGGGLDIETGMTFLEATILALNTAATGPNCIGTFQSNGFNLVGTTTNCTFGPTGTDHSNVTTPKLGSLAANGGPTMTIALVGGSPAIDQVPTAFCHSQVKKDQRGTARPQGPKCDEGAFERKSS